MLPPRDSFGPFPHRQSRITGELSATFAHPAQILPLLTSDIAFREVD
jgi:hypothetical protein